MGRELPAPYLLFDERFTIRIDFEIPTRKSAFHPESTRENNRLPLLEFVDDLFWVAYSLHQF